MSEYSKDAEYEGNIQKSIASAKDNQNLKLKTQCYSYQIQKCVRYLGTNITNYV